MNTEKKTGERVGITLALLACVLFSAFLIWLQQKQETDRERLTEQIQDRQQEEQIKSGQTEPLQIRTRLQEQAEGNQPVFSLPGGFYPEEITVEITAEEGSRIYYTTDGTVPDETQGILYEAPVEVTNVCGEPNVYAAISSVSAYQDYAPLAEVDKAFVLQAVAIDDRGEKSQVTCASYFIAMEAKGTYRELPVLSLTTDPAGLFDYFTGNYVTGVDYENALAADDLRFDSANYYRGGEIAAHLEYFEVDRYLTYAGDVTLSLRKDGNLDYGQKSFLLSEAVPAPGEASELQELFRDGAVLLYGGGTDYATKTRQILEETLLRKLGVDVTPAERQGCVVFVDGEFWGLYLMSADRTPQTFAAKGGVPAEEIQIAQGSYPSQIDPGLQELYRLVTETDAGRPGMYERIQAQMDVDSYLDYYCANLYFGNPQFDSFSTMIWRTQGAEGNAGKWHWEFSDATDTLGRNRLSSYSLNTCLCPGVAQDLFFGGLLKNPEFREAFLSRMQKYAEELTEDAARECLEPLTEHYRAAVTATAERYGLRQTEEGYLADGEKILEYFAKRGEYILRYTEEFATTGNRPEAAAQTVEE